MDETDHVNYRQKFPRNVLVVQRTRVSLRNIFLVGYLQFNVINEGWHGRNDDLKTFGMLVSL